MLSYQGHMCKHRNYPHKLLCFSHSGLEILFAEIENDLMSLSTMLKSPYSSEFRWQMQDWVQSLQELGK